MLKRWHIVGLYYLIGGLNGGAIHRIFVFVCTALKNYYWLRAAYSRIFGSDMKPTLVIAFVYSQLFLAFIAGYHQAYFKSQDKF